MTWGVDFQTGLLRERIPQTPWGSDIDGNSKTLFGVGSIGVGIGTPVSKIHIDAGTATASEVRFTAGVTTGQTSTDGFLLGIASNGDGKINQRENLDIGFFTSNTERARIRGVGRLTVGDVTETVAFFPVAEQVQQVCGTITAIGSSFSPLDLIQSLNPTNLIVDPVANTGSGVGATIYTAAGGQTNIIGNKVFSGLAVAGAAFPISVFGNFASCNNQMTGGSLDAAAAGLFGMGHSGYGGVGGKHIGGYFNSDTTDDAGAGTPTGSIDDSIGAYFTSTAGGIVPTRCISGKFIEPYGYDLGTGLGVPTLLNKTAIDCDGTLTIRRADVATAASVTGMTFDKSFQRFTGSTATNLHGIKADTFSKFGIVYNQSSASVTVKHQSGTEGTAANRIITYTGADVVITSGRSGIFIYDDAQSRWILLMSS